MPKNNTRTVKVTYVEELSTSAGRACYSLPLSFTAPLPSYSYKVLICRVLCSSAPRLICFQVSVDISEGGSPQITTDDLDRLSLVALNSTVDAVGKVPVAL